MSCSATSASVGIEAGADRRAHEFRAPHIGAGRRVGVLADQVADAGGVDVAGDHDRVVGAGGGQLVEDAGPSGGVAVPLVEVVDGAGEGHRGHHDLVGQDVPRGPGLAQAAAQPGLLAGAEQGAVRGRAFRAGGADVVRPAGLVAAVLTSVQHVEPGQPPPVDGSVDAQVGAGRRGQSHRLVLPPGLVRGGPPGREPRGLGGHLREKPGVVVLDLVVVPGHNPGAGGVDALQRRVALVEAVAVAVGVQGRDLGAVVLADGGGVGPALVDVVAEMDHQVGVLLGRKSPRRPEAVLPVLARREQEAQPISAPGRRCRPGATHRADLVTDAEAVEVPGVRAEVADVDVDRVRPTPVTPLRARRARHAGTVRRWPPPSGPAHRPAASRPPPAAPAPAGSTARRRLGWDRRMPRPARTDRRGGRVPGAGNALRGRAGRPRPRAAPAGCRPRRSGSDDA